MVAISFRSFCWRSKSITFARAIDSARLRGLMSHPSISVRTKEEHKCVYTIQRWSRKWAIPTAKYLLECSWYNCIDRTPATVAFIFTVCVISEYETAKTYVVHMVFLTGEFKLNNTRAFKSRIVLTLRSSFFHLGL